MEKTWIVVSLECDNMLMKCCILTYVIISSTETNDNVKDKSATNKNDNSIGKS